MISTLIIAVAFNSTLVYPEMPPSVTPETVTESSTEQQVLYISYYDIPLSRELQTYTKNVCEEYGVPETIAYGVMYVESGFDASARNKHCTGIMQIHKIAKKELKEIGITDLADVKQNIKAGVYLISKFYCKYHDWHKALVCFNCGESGSSNIITSYYSNKVMDYAGELIPIYEEQYIESEIS